MPTAAMPKRTADSSSKSLITSTVHTGKHGIEDEEKVRQKKQKQQREYREPDSPANEMMQAVLAQPGARRAMPVKVHRSRLLNASLEKYDPRNAIVERNNAESPLFAVLPSEIRNEIFAYALGGQHIHILTDSYEAEDDKPDVAETGTSTSKSTIQYLPSPRFFLQHDSRKFERVEAWKFYNCVYPLYWRNFCSLKAPDHSRIRYLGLCPDVQTIKASSVHMTLVPVICRQIYHETKFLPYALNEFSFQDELTMKDWFRNRVAAQKRALGVVWLNLECEYAHLVFRWNRSLFGADCGLKRVVVPTSALDRLAEHYMTAAWPRPRYMEEKQQNFKKLLLTQLKKTEATLQIQFVD